MLGDTPPKKEPPKGPLPPSKFKITVAADVPPGNYDVRVVNKFGVSNPRVFVVGDLNELQEKEPNNDVPEAMMHTRAKAHCIPLPALHRVDTNRRAISSARTATSSPSPICRPRARRAG